ncbi:hypothetical protein QOT17_015632 [Balamuthia mandrillaris]
MVSPIEIRNGHLNKMAGKDKLSDPQDLVGLLDVQGPVLRHVGNHRDHVPDLGAGLPILLGRTHLLAMDQQPAARSWLFLISASGEGCFDERQHNKQKERNTGTNKQSEAPWLWDFRPAEICHPTSVNQAGPNSCFSISSK